MKVPVLVDYGGPGPARHRSSQGVSFHACGPDDLQLALRKLLFKAGLKYEIRVDEAGKPFLWVRTVKPV